jgi:hypothetical protein
VQLAHDCHVALAFRTISRMIGVAQYERQLRSDLQLDDADHSLKSSLIRHMSWRTYCSMCRVLVVLLEKLRVAVTLHGTCTLYVFESGAHNTDPKALLMVWRPCDHAVPAQDAIERKGSMWIEETRNDKQMPFLTAEEAV